MAAERSARPASSAEATQSCRRVHLRFVARNQTAVAPNRGSRQDRPPCNGPLRRASHRCSSRMDSRLPAALAKRKRALRGRIPPRACCRPSRPFPLLRPTPRRCFLTMPRRTMFATQSSQKRIGRGTLRRRGRNRYRTRTSQVVSMPIPRPQPTPMIPSSERQFPNIPPRVNNSSGMRIPDGSGTNERDPRADDAGIAGC